MPYHLKVRDHFKQQRKIWDFFAIAGTGSASFQPDTQKPGEEEELVEEEAFIAHTSARAQLLSLADGELEVTDRIITAIAANDSSTPSYRETARLFRLYTEIYCDRGALVVLGDITPVINMLLKVAPAEAPVRTQALRCWFEKKEAAEPEIARMIEGLPELDRLDIFSQKELADLTQDVLLYYLGPKWFQSALVIRLARQYFPDLFGEQPVVREERPASRGNQPALSPEQIAAKIAAAHPSVKEYFAWLLLDFARVDPSLKEGSSGRAMQLAEEMQLSAVYDGIAKKEGQVSDKK
jgi:hypothetical protein